MISFVISLSDKIPQKARPLVEDKLEVNPENLQFKLQAFDDPQIKKVFGKFKTSKGFGPDGIANHFLKIAFFVIAESLCDIFNLSIATGVFPENWKTARVTPIFKSGEKTIVPIIDRFLCSHFCQDSLRN